MQAGANAGQEAQQAITGHISTLRGEVEQMMGGWRGEAAAAFTNVHNSFEENAGRINAALARMHEALVATQQTYGRLTSTLEELEQRLNPMIQTWTGQAQEAYLQCKTEWDQAAANLATVLNSIGQAVGTAHDNYRAAENTAKGNWA